MILTRQDALWDMQMAGLDGARLSLSVPFLTGCAIGKPSNHGRSLDDRTGALVLTGKRPAAYYLRPLRSVRQALGLA